MGNKEKVPQFVLKAPQGMKVPVAVQGRGSTKSASSRHSPQRMPEPAPSTVYAPAPAPAQANASAPAPSSSAESAFSPAFAPASASASFPPGPAQQRTVRTESQPEVKVTESYLSAKLRQSEKRGRSKQMAFAAPDSNVRLDDIWREMEDQIAFKAPPAAQLPSDFLRNMGMAGETILISPRAVEALKAMAGRKKNG